jgi:hypothetical protein
MIIIQNTIPTIKRIETYHKKRCFVRAKYNIVIDHFSPTPKFKTIKDLRKHFDNQIISLREKYSVKYA